MWWQRFWCHNANVWEKALQHNAKWKQRCDVIIPSDDRGFDVIMSSDGNSFDVIMPSDGNSFYIIMQSDWKHFYKIMPSDGKKVLQHDAKWWQLLLTFKSYFGSDQASVWMFNFQEV